MLASSMCSGVLISHSTSSFTRRSFLLPALRIHLQILNHWRCERAIGGYPVARLALVLAGAYARPDERIWAQVALDVGRNDFSRDAIACDKPLICTRHGEGEMCRKEGDERKEDTDVSVRKGPSYGS